MQARAVMAEWAFLQLLKASPAKVSAAALEKMRSEAEFMGVEKVSTRLIHPAVWKVVQNALTSA